MSGRAKIRSENNAGLQVCPMNLKRDEKLGNLKPTKMRAFLGWKITLKQAAANGLAVAGQNQVYLKTNGGASSSMVTCFFARSAGL